MPGIRMVPPFWCRGIGDLVMWVGTSLLACCGVVAPLAVLGACHREFGDSGAVIGMRSGAASRVSRVDGSPTSSTRGVGESNGPGLNGTLCVSEVLRADSKGLGAGCSSLGHAPLAETAGDPPLPCLVYFFCSTGESHWCQEVSTVLGMGDRWCRESLCSEIFHTADSVTDAGAHRTKTASMRSCFNLKSRSFLVLG